VIAGTLLFFSSMCYVIVYQQQKHAANFFKLCNSKKLPLLVLSNGAMAEMQSRPLTSNDHSSQLLWPVVFFQHVLSWSQPHLNCWYFRYRNSRRVVSPEQVKTSERAEGQTK